jgi:hypothetical protein
MRNPFKAAGSAVASMFKGTTMQDELPAVNPLTPFAVALTPIVAPVAFVAAFFQKPDAKGK